MSLHNIFFLLALLVPLSIDAFILSAALGMAGLHKKDRLRTSMVLAGFEGGMPLLGAMIGHGLGSAIGSYGIYAAAVVIGFAGVLMLMPSNEEREQKQVRLLSHAKGWLIVNLGLSISIDGLAIGLSLGLLHVSILFIAIYVALQTFLASRLGLWLGGRLSETFKERAEMAGGLMLVLVALLFIAAGITGHQI
jgi:manganese efflux pump family protein